MVHVVHRKFTVHQLHWLTIGNAYKRIQKIIISMIAYKTFISRNLLARKHASPSSGNYGRAHSRPIHQQCTQFAPTDVVLQSDFLSTALRWRRSFKWTSMKLCNCFRGTCRAVSPTFGKRHVHGFRRMRRSRHVSIGTNQQTFRDQGFQAVKGQHVWQL